MVVRDPGGEGRGDQAFFPLARPRRIHETKIRPKRFWENFPPPKVRPCHPRTPRQHGRPLPENLQCSIPEPHLATRANAGEEAEWKPRGSFCPQSLLSPVGTVTALPGSLELNRHEHDLIFPCPPQFERSLSNFGAAVRSDTPPKEARKTVREVMVHEYPGIRW